MLDDRNHKFRNNAFLLQFLGDEYDINNRLGLNRIDCYYAHPIFDMLRTGFFGIVDALIDLKLTNHEISDFYVYGHVEPYTDPFSFTKGIIEIINGMPKNEIEDKYGDYLNEESIENFKPNRNIQMLVSFYYDKNDIYEFIPNKDDLYNKFVKNCDRIYHHFGYNTKEKDFQKIDGKLYRVVHFLVCHGYDFPKLEDLFDESITELEFKQTKGKNIFILNKAYARKMSNNLLSFVCFLKKNNYKVLNPEGLFDEACDNIIIMNSNGKQINFNCNYLEENAYKYTELQLNLSFADMKVWNITSLYDNRVKDIELIFQDKDEREYKLIAPHDKILSIPEHFYRIIKKGFNLGFLFPDDDNLFDMEQKFLKITDPNGKEQLVIRDEFSRMLDIIICCKQRDFNIDFNSLFDINKNKVKLISKEGIETYISRNKIIDILEIYSLLMENGYSFKDYDSLFNELEPFIVCFDKNNEQKVISRKQMNKILKLERLANSYGNHEELTNSEKDILFTLRNSIIRQKLFEWLPFTAKKWLPSSAIINKIPAEKSYEYFYNNNHTRLKVLKDKFQAHNYEEMEGIVTLGYILGMFDSKESTSEKAMNYILDNFLEKGITADELHTTYGAIDLQKGYDKNFADFFMKHYAKFNESFIEPDLGTNMTKELFERFDEVLEKRPEKRIKTRTRNKLLTPIDAMAVITHFEVTSDMLGEKINDERYIRLVQFLLKFGASKSEIKWAIRLYEQALQLDEQKVSIPHILDLESYFMKFNSHLKSDVQAFVSGRKTNCCSRYGGLAQDRLTHIITDLDWRYVTFTSPNTTFFDGLVWYDKEEHIVCIDNVEGQFSKKDERNPNSVAMMADSIIRYADKIYHTMNEQNIPCKKINVGNDPGTASFEIFKYAKEQNLIYDETNPCNYPERNHISTDAQRQFTITDENTLKLRRKY